MIRLALCVLFSILKLASGKIGAQTNQDGVFSGQNINRFLTFSDTSGVKFENVPNY